MRAAALRLVALGGALVTGCGAGDASSAIQTKPVRHVEGALALAGDDLRVTAPGYVRGLTPGLSSSDELTVISVSRKDIAGLRHARLQQAYAGVPVFGSEVIAHAEDITFLGFNGFVTTNLDGFDTTTVLTAAEALAIAKKELSGGSALRTLEESTLLVILPKRDGHGANLAWQVEVLNARQGDIEAGLWNYFIDAREGAVLRKLDSLVTETVVQASGAGGGKKAHSWSQALDVVADAGLYKMETERLTTTDLGNNEQVVKGPLDDMPDAAANDAHGFAEVTLNMMRDWMGRSSLDDKGFKVDSLVKTPSPSRAERRVG